MIKNKALIILVGISIGLLLIIGGCQQSSSTKAHQQNLPPVIPIVTEETTATTQTGIIQSEIDDINKVSSIEDSTTTSELDNLVGFVNGI